MIFTLRTEKFKQKILKDNIESRSQTRFKIAHLNDLS